jgi:hypothetical protein
MIIPGGAENRSICKENTLFLKFSHADPSYSIGFTATWGAPMQFSTFGLNLYSRARLQLHEVEIKPSRTKMRADIELAFGFAETVPRVLPPWRRALNFTAERVAIDAKTGATGLRSLQKSNCRMEAGGEAVNRQTRPTLSQEVFLPSPTFRIATCSRTLPIYPAPSERLSSTEPAE